MAKSTATPWRRLKPRSLRWRLILARPTTTALVQSGRHPSPASHPSVVRGGRLAESRRDQLYGQVNPHSASASGILRARDRARWPLSSFCSPPTRRPMSSRRIPARPAPRQIDPRPESASAIPRAGDRARCPHALPSLTPLQQLPDAGAIVRPNR